MRRAPEQLQASLRREQPSALRLIPGRWPASELTMNKSTRAAIERHALAEYPRECCGLVIREGRKEVYVPCRNTASTPSEHFRLAPEDFAAAEDRGQVLAVVHTRLADRSQVRPWRARLLEHRPRLLLPRNGHRPGPVRAGGRVVGEGPEPLPGEPARGRVRSSQRPSAWRHGADADSLEGAEPGRGILGRRRPEDRARTLPGAGDDPASPLQPRQQAGHLWWLLAGSYGELLAA